MNITLRRFTAPSEWASYLINGDASGLDPAELGAARSWRASIGLGDPVDCIEVGFMRDHDAGGFAPAANCEEFTFYDTKEAAA